MDALFYSIGKALFNSEEFSMNLKCYVPDSACFDKGDI